MIYDTEDNPLSYFPLHLSSGETQTFTMRVECRTGYFLRSEAVAGLTVSARRVEDATWINIETDAIDLSPWAGTRQNFEIRLVADTVTEAARRNFKLTVSL